jgi:hypothetical protein
MSLIETLERKGPRKLLALETIRERLEPPYFQGVPVSKTAFSDSFLDGGGVHGLISIEILARIEELLRAGPGRALRAGRLL